MSNKKTIIRTFAGALALVILLLAVTGVWAGPDSRSPTGPSASAAPSAPAAAISSTLSYQGRLLDSSGNPIDATRVMTFSLYAQASGGAFLWSDSFPVPVEDGLFDVGLEVDPGLFVGQQLWLGVHVGGDAQEMTPRQQLLPAPYALYAKVAPWDGLANVPPDLTDGDDDTLYSAGIGMSLAGTTFEISTTYRLPQACGDGDIAEWNGAGGTWDCGSDDVGEGPAAWLLGGNTGTTPGADVLGTNDPVSLTLVVDAAPALRLEPGAVPNVVGGDGANRVNTGVAGATIGGGGNTAAPNRITDEFGTVGGGSGNQAGNNSGGVLDAVYATVGGGYYNQAVAEYTTIGGGESNTADFTHATVGGGESNLANNAHTTIGGGLNITVTGAYATVGGGSDNKVTLNSWYATIGGGKNNSIANIAPYATVGGGYYNTASGYFATIGGGEIISVTGYAATVAGGSCITATGDYATVGGGGGNVVTGTYATIGGGEDNIAGGDAAAVGGGTSNTASGAWATIGGGWLNRASSWWTTVGGGLSNTASSNVSTVGGGTGNTANGSRATVGGGDTNRASGSDSTVSGGDHNVVNGDHATVPGGAYNSADGDYSFAAGRRARAAADGCFAWGDSTDTDFNCNNPNRFMVRATGGVYLYTNSSLNSGLYMSAGGSSWNGYSDRQRKENFEPVDAQALLTHLAEIPITTWNYKAQDPSIRHVGPMAQDFNALLPELGGEGEKFINTLDADGVALAAIQGLYAQNQTLAAENAALQTQVDDLEARVAAMEQTGTVHPAQALANWGPLVGSILLAGIVVARRRRQEGKR